MLKTRIVIAAGATALLAACSSRSTTLGRAPFHSGASTTAPPTAVSTPRSSPTASPSGDCVTRTVQSLDLPHQVGQLLMIGTDVDNPDTLDATVAGYHLGGVFLHGRSTRTAAALKTDIAKLQTA